ncbi:prepilin-type N-terminal cleavage/methylation domain-containing protein [Candidatus Kaiserbacteria bacterium]|nr:prepilin-type N-terminal cleavage/methylation domain-containing protein [Candidatus Kaiserbacteria bacterium]
MYSVSHRGFTLVEMLVAVSIFAVVMVVSVGTLIVLVTSSSVTQRIQSLTTNLSFATDMMTRDIRTGHTYYCTGSIGGTLPSGTQDCASGETGIVFTNSETDARTAYRFNSSESSLELRIESGSWIRITSPEVTVEDARFYVTGSARGNDTQPRARVVLRGVPTDSTLPVSTFYLQSTLTQRIVDF